MNTEIESVEIDYLSELLNLGMGYVSRELGEILQGEIILTVPEVDFIPADQLMIKIGIDYHEEIVAIRQTLEGDFSSEAVLMMPKYESLNMIRKLLNDEKIDHITGLEKDVLLDITNIIINGIIYTFNNKMKIDINTGLPEFQQGFFDSLFQLWDYHNDDEPSIYFAIGFKLDYTDITGKLVFFQNLSSLNTFIEKVKDILIQEGII